MNVMNHVKANILCYDWRWHQRPSHRSSV
jgi:hypothetical protein